MQRHIAGSPARRRAGGYPFRARPDQDAGRDRGADQNLHDISQAGFGRGGLGRRARCRGEAITGEHAARRRSRRRRQGQRCGPAHLCAPARRDRSRRDHQRGLHGGSQRRRRGRRQRVLLSADRFQRQRLRLRIDAGRALHVGHVTRRSRRARPHMVRHGQAVRRRRRRKRSDAAGRDLCGARQGARDADAMPTPDQPAANGRGCHGRHHHDHI